MTGKIYFLIIVIKNIDNNKLWIISAGKNNEGYHKSWFYFSVQGFNKYSSVEFKIKNINMLSSML
jgi:hypothetical protein